MIFLDGFLVLFAEGFEWAEVVGHEEVHEGPEFAEVVFHGGAGEAEAVFGAELGGGVGEFGLGGFDVLGFVEDDEVEVVLGELGDVALEEGEGGDDDVGVGDGAELAAAVRAFEGEDPEGRGEFFGFGGPVGEDAGGRDDEGGFALVAVGFDFEEDVGEGLEGFAEAHVVGEDAGEAVGGEELHPGDALVLVGAELGVKALWEWGGGEFFEGLEGVAEGFEGGWEGVGGEEVGVLGVELEGVEGVEFEGISREAAWVDEADELAHDGAEACGVEAEGVSVGEVVEEVALGGEFERFFDVAFFEEVGEDGEEVDALSVDVDACGEGEPVAGGGFDFEHPGVFVGDEEVVAHVGVVVEVPGGWDEEFGLVAEGLPEVGELGGGEGGEPEGGLGERGVALHGGEEEDAEFGVVEGGLEAELVHFFLGAPFGGGVARSPEGFAVLGEGEV